ncbi:MAG: site-specific DNA-methyltransferase, partial [Thermoguttaceae bacterium]
LRVEIMDRNTTFEKMRMESADMIGKNVEKIAELFPECVTEAADQDGKIRRLVDFEKLREILSGDVAEEPERYDFTWVGKSAALAEAHTPIRKTLRPCPKESRDWDTTQNLYIEGDNLDVLKLLQESYLGQVKMIYIDPPYNTGSDLIYRDEFKMDKDKYNASLLIYDEDKNRLFKNTDSNGRLHSNWCSMIYPRLILARNLLRDDGIIFISIDDHEVENLKKICSEVFGMSNFIACLNWKWRGGRQDSKYFASVHEYILCFAKDASNFVAGEAVKSGDVYPLYDEGSKRFYKKQLLRKWGSNSLRENRPNLFYPINAPDGSQVYPMVSRSVEGRWRWKKERMQEALNNDLVLFTRDSDGTWIPYEKIYAPLEGDEKTQKYATWIDDVSNGTAVLKDLFKRNIFDYPKSPQLISLFLNMANIEENDIVMDFFSGSATTAHAVMQLNASKGINSHFIMVQIPEICDIESEASKAGYSSICEIGKERIRRAGDKIKKENSLVAQDLDAGFRVLKVDTTNMNDVFYGASEVSQDLIKSTESNIKDDRTELDLLFGCLLDWGVPLSYPYKSEEINGITVHDYNEGALIACFAENVPQNVVEQIARRKPMRAVFRDSCFETDAAKINVTELFKRYSPDTRIKTI